LAKEAVSDRKQRPTLIKKRGKRLQRIEYKEVGRLVGAVGGLT
jgi:hypothetical protein